MADGPEVL
jgi:uncharacterized damage-inducible protein DinB